ncbi:MAG: efflux RND transporter periplasmic adaptor subunit [Xenococcus sp. MO_188.B8]|nr:efflux RND transporter periplasmic adaptor subunit [Xenococcus sp. MO_188.B8]
MNNIKVKLNNKYPINLATTSNKNKELDQYIFNFKPNSDLEPEVILPISNSTQKKPKMIRVLIAEDQLTCQQIWQSYLEPEPDLEIIGIAIDGQVAVELVNKLEPDVILMDINMPRMDGLSATEIITNRYVGINILLLSISDNVQDIQKSLRIGAKGYFLKSAPPQELVTAIRNIHKGYFQLGQGLIEKLDSETSAISEQQLEHAHHKQQLEQALNGSDLINLSKSKLLCPERAEPASNLENSVVVFPQETSQKRLIEPNFNMLLLMLSGLLVMFLIQSDHKWVSQLSNSSTLLPHQVVPSQDSSATTILPVETIKVNPVDSYQRSRFYTGSAVARYTSQLGFERSGQLVRINVDEGDQVTTGTPLAYLDTSNLKVQQQELLAQRAQAVAQLKEMQAGPRAETIAAAQASVRNLQSQLELAEKKRSRRESLLQQGAISREQLDEVVSETSVLQARLDEAQSQLDELQAGTRPERIEAQVASIKQLDASLANLEVELAKSILKAPFAGTISARKADEGTVISPGQSVMSLVGNEIEVHIGMPVSTAERIQLGSTWPLQIGAQTYQARVSSLLPVLDSSTRTVTVVLTLDNLVTKAVSPGQVARLKLVEQIPTSGFWLPTTALVQGGRGLWSCYVLGEPAQSESIASEAINFFHIQRRDVEILQTESDRVLVRGTIQPGDQVIVNGTHRLVPGQLVRPMGKLL